jgi:hypothetical protein
MNEVWKFTLESHLNPQQVDMPKGAQIVNVAMQGDYLRIWAIVDPEAPLEPRKLYVFGTGFPIPKLTTDLKYRGTAVGSWLVWHVFEEVA